MPFSNLSNKKYLFSNTTQLAGCVGIAPTKPRFGVSAPRLRTSQNQAVITFTFKNYFLFWPIQLPIKQASKHEMTELITKLVPKVGLAPTLNSLTGRRATLTLLGNKRTGYRFPSNAGLNTRTRQAWLPAGQIMVEQVAFASTSPTLTIQSGNIPSFQSGHYPIWSPQMGFSPIFLNCLSG